MIDQFCEAAEAVGATIKRFSGTGGVASYIREISAGETVSASELPERYRRLVDGITLAPPERHADAGFCISAARAGIARTGSLFLDLSDPTGRSATALPLVHLVLLDAATILPDLRAAAPLLAEHLNHQECAYLSLTTGPSRTADIERVLTIGVHGPKELHILIMEGA